MRYSPLMKGGKGDLLNSKNILSSCINILYLKNLNTPMMKKLFTLFIAITLFTSAKAQTWVSVTDSNFINYLALTVAGLSNNNSWYNVNKTAINSADYDVQNVWSINFNVNGYSPNSIYSFEGIEAFTNLNSISIDVNIMPNGFPGNTSYAIMPTLQFLTDFEVYVGGSNSFGHTTGDIYIFNTVKNFKFYGGLYLGATIYNLSPQLTNIKLFDWSYINATV